MSSIFNDPERVRQQLNLPAVIEYSVIGLSSAEYHAKLEELIVRLVGDENIHRRSFRESSGGAYTAYRFAIFQSEFEDVEAFYRQVGALTGTKAVL
jgi:putative lipoic acid-binding regulatory protein